MNAKQALRAAGDMSLFVLKAYLADLSDADLLVRPGPGCNHLAWQLGHLIASEANMVRGMASGPGCELPAGFAEAHSKEACGVDDPSKFLSKQQYLDLFDQVRAASWKSLDALDEAALDQPSPEWIRSMFPTMGQYWTLIATHALMHAGQFAVVRRAIGKPIVI